MSLVAQTLRECCSDLQGAVQLTDEAYLGRKRKSGIDDRRIAVFYARSEDEIRVISAAGTRPYRTANPDHWTKNKDLKSEVIYSCSADRGSLQEITVLIVAAITLHVSALQEEDYEYPPADIFVLPSEAVIRPALTQLEEWRERDAQQRAEEQRHALQVPDETLRQTAF